MKKKNKRIVSFIGLLVLSFLIGFWLYPAKHEDGEYIFDKSYQISLEDVQKARTPLSFDKSAQQTGFLPDDSTENQEPETDAPQQKLSPEDLKKIFSEGLINSHTTFKYFKHLEHMFRKSASIDEHLELVKKHLFSEFPESEAQQLFDTYKKYLECEIALLEEYRNLSNVKSMNEAIEMLKKIQEFRRSRLGKDLADKLFGADVKAKEYAFRRADIVGNNALYGKEKEDLLKKLNEDMWGDESNAVEKFEPDTPIAWQRFNEKQAIYQKDLDELASEDAKEARIKEYRTDFFSPDVVKRLEEVDQQIAVEEQTEIAYRDKEKAIIEDKAMPEDEKNQKIKTLQDQMFGEEADAFRRRETMRIELEKMAKEHPQKKD
jgi:lipase chaperone LimK